MPFEKHTNLSIRQAFLDRPFQGAHPETASFVFLGLDANFDSAIEDAPVFQYVQDYLRDGVQFWRTHHVHHPFCLPCYCGGGKRFHARFASMGLSCARAERISFVEVLNIPTVGRSRLVSGDLCRAHLAWIHASLRSGETKTVFLSPLVMRLLTHTGVFPIKAAVPCTAEKLGSVMLNSSLRAHVHYHFSAYGPFHPRFHLAQIKDIIECN